MQSKEKYSKVQQDKRERERDRMNEACRQGRKRSEEMFAISCE